MHNSKAKIIINVSATLEILVGLILIVALGFTIHYLLGDGLTEIGASVARIAGIALISLGVSALEITNQPIKKSTRIGLLFWNK